MAFLLLVVFGVVNAVLMPFGLVYGVFSLLQGCSDATTWYGRFEWLVFLIFASPIMSLLYFCDLFFFASTLFQTVEEPKLERAACISHDSSTKLMDAITTTLLDE